MKQKLSSIALVLIGSWLMAPSAWALRITVEGNQPQSPENYQDWPGIIEVVNHPSRIRLVWVNGNESTYFRGDARALTESLLRFALVKVDKIEVVVRPRSAPQRELAGVDCNWQLDLVGGIARDAAGEVPPRITVYVDDNLRVADLNIPKRLQVIGLAAARRTYLAGLGSSDPYIRRQSASGLADLNPYDSESVAAVAKLLDDPDTVVRNVAVHAIGRFAPAAKAAFLADHVQALPDPALADAAQKAIDAIDKSTDDLAAKKKFDETAAAIEKYLHSRSAAAEGGR